MKELLSVDDFKVCLSRRCIADVPFSQRSYLALKEDERNRPHVERLASPLCPARKFGRQVPTFLIAALGVSDVFARVVYEAVYQLCYQLHKGLKDKSHR